MASTAATHFAFRWAAAFLLASRSDGATQKGYSVTPQGFQRRSVYLGMGDPFIGDILLLIAVVAVIAVAGWRVFRKLRD